MENVLALQALRQDSTDVAFAGASSNLSVACTVYVIIITIIT